MIIEHILQLQLLRLVDNKREIENVNFLIWTTAGKILLFGPYRFGIGHQIRLYSYSTANDFNKSSYNSCIYLRNVIQISHVVRNLQRILAAHFLFNEKVLI